MYYTPPALRYPAGSIQHVAGVPSHLANLYKTARDLNFTVYIDMASDRAAYIDQNEAMFADFPLKNPEDAVTHTTHLN